MKVEGRDPQENLSPAEPILPLKEQIDLSRKRNPPDPVEDEVAIVGPKWAVKVLQTTQESVSMLILLVFGVIAEKGAQKDVQRVDLEAILTNNKELACTIQTNRNCLLQKLQNKCHKND